MAFLLRMCAMHPALSCPAPVYHHPHPCVHATGSLYLICRTVLILRGLCDVLGLKDVSNVSMWAPCAKAGLSQPIAALSEAHAAENAWLARGSHT